MTIVRTTYRYKRPPKKPKAVALEVPRIVTAKQPKRRDAPVQRLGNAASPADTAAPEPTGSAIVAVRRKPARVLPPGLLPDTPEEHKRRGAGADALFQQMKRRIAEKLSDR